MKAKHVMTAPVKTGKAEMTVREAAQIMSECRISALPIVDQSGSLVGIVSEGDLVRRAEIGTQRQRSWWLSLLTTDERLADEYARSHAAKIADIMTRKVISVDPNTPLSDIARIFERNQIKRVPVMESGKLVGIVTRSNLVQAVATAPQKKHLPLDDDEIREKIQSILATKSWAKPVGLNVTVNEGHVDLWGITRSDAERNAIRVLVEKVHGVKAVDDNLFVEPSLLSSS
ncbi:MAG: CBS domain-containing protein [Rhizobiales bacterium]|nr:CBS domain-containing protein [Hyphomicrobiales bacterium]